MKLTLIALVVVGALVCAADEYYCGRYLLETLELLCPDYDVSGAIDAQQNKHFSMLSPKGGNAVCCLKACTFDELMDYYCNGI